MTTLRRILSAVAAVRVAPTRLAPNKLAHARRAAAAALLLAASMGMGGCGVAAFGSYLINGPDRDQPTEIKGEYFGLNNKNTAVIVAADEYTYYEYPGAPLAVSRAVSQKLQAAVTGIKLTEPQKVVAFQKDNPYWNTLSYSELIKRLKVDRLVYIDLSEYGLHEPGNANVWRGVVIANIGIVEADGKNPDDFSYSTTVKSQYPPDRPIGLLESDDKTVQNGLLSQFSTHVSGLFNEKGSSVPNISK
ncbi:MAG: hypothetical protein NTW19_14495 [Planctomycetota bacterium]|nr:hypothetical protein [Planctomycetota bacterium]